MGLEMSKANILARINRLRRIVISVLYGVSFLFPMTAAVSVYIIGLEATRLILVIYGSITFILLFSVLFNLIRNNPYKIERPELSQGAKLVTLGYGFMIFGEAIGAGFFRLIDLAFVAIAIGIPFVAAGCFIMTTMTFAGIYAHLDVGFVLSYGGTKVEMTNLGGMIEEGHKYTSGVRIAEKILQITATQVQETMKTGRVVSVPQVKIPDLKKEAIYRIDIVPHTKSADGKVLSVIVIVKDVTATLRNYETEQLKHMIAKLKNERDKALNLADVLRHDTANILQGIQAAVDIVAMSVKEDMNLLEDIGIAQEGLKRAIELIGVVRDLRQAEEERGEIRPINVSYVIDNAVARLKREHENQNIRVGIMIRPMNLEIYADKYIEQSLFHLLRYCAPKEREKVNINVQAYLDEQSDKILIEVLTFENVADPSQRKSLLHWRSEAARPGESLSIPFVKMIVERNGGNIDIQDRVPCNPRAGTKFIISLPATGEDIRKQSTLNRAAESA
ncbi:MAG: sensor histidine kinase [Candidatus Thorarchaeota archaeon]